ETWIDVDGVHPEAPDQAVARGEEHGRSKRQPKTCEAKVLGPPTLAEEQRASDDDEHRTDDDSGDHRLTEEQERNRDGKERSRPDRDRRARRTGVANRGR